ncbi:MAG: helix-turn-helix domain-containing protein [Lachnospiraceae bacterium]|nr:helix-turn-helix domain-containing protein [Lachnospiraceae bacterium]
MSEKVYLENTDDSSTMEDRFGKCPYATVQELISGKWAVLILYYLEDGPVRFNELQRLMPKMSHATLSVQLKALVSKGIVKRTEDPDVPQKVEYALTDIGEKFKPVLQAISEWGREYIEYLKKNGD